MKSILKRVLCYFRNSLSRFIPNLPPLYKSLSQTLQVAMRPIPRTRRRDLQATHHWSYFFHTAFHEVWECHIFKLAVIEDRIKYHVFWIKHPYLLPNYKVPIHRWNLPTDLLPGASMHLEFEQPGWV